MFSYFLVPLGVVKDISISGCIWFWGLTSVLELVSDAWTCLSFATEFFLLEYTWLNLGSCKVSLVVWFPSGFWETSCNGVGCDWIGGNG